MVSGDRSKKNAIVFKKERCLRSRSTWTSCALCVDSCPGGAIHISFEDKFPAVERSSCLRCGQCLSSCPLEAFESPSFSERRLLRRINDESMQHSSSEDNGSSIYLRCFLFPNEHDSIRLGHNTYQLGTCLAALTPGALFELAFTHTCELATDKCLDCELYTHVAQTMKYNGTWAKLLLSDWDKTGQLKETTALFLTQVDEVNTTKRIGYRDGVAMMRSNIRSLFHGSKQKPGAGKKPLPLRVKKQRIPTWRLRLKDYWQAFERLTTGNTPWPSLVVDKDHCKACGICMQLCPTGSIRHTLEDDRFSFAFTPATCVNCGLCIVSCASAAIHRAYQSALQPYQESVILSRSARLCVRCKLPVLDDRESHCYLCLSEPDLNTFVELVKKHMARSAQLAKTKRSQY